MDGGGVEGRGRRGPATRWQAARQQHPSTAGRPPPAESGAEWTSSGPRATQEFTMYRYLTTRAETRRGEQEGTRAHAGGMHAGVDGPAHHKYIWVRQRQTPKLYRERDSRPMPQFSDRRLGLNSAFKCVQCASEAGAHSRLPSPVTSPVLQFTTKICSASIDLYGRGV